MTNGTNKSKPVCRCTCSISSVVKGSASASTKVVAGRGPKRAAARSSSSGVAGGTVRAGVPVVKHSGWPVSPSRAKKVCATLVAGPEGEGAGGADEELLLEIGVEHGGTCTGWGAEENRCGQANAGRRQSLIK